jgi:hypothetical protein
MAGYLWAGLILPVSVGAAAHSLILSAVKFLAPQQAIVRILTFASAPVLPFVSATTGWEHYTEGVPIPIAVATLAYGLACAFGPQVVARLLAAPPVTQSNSDTTAKFAGRILLRRQFSGRTSDVRIWKRRRKGALTTTAESFGATLGRLAGRVDRLNRERRELAAELRHLTAVAQGMLRDLGSFAADDVQRLRKGGRPKGYKMSAATKRKLREAWKRRKAAAKSTA